MFNLVLVFLLIENSNLGKTFTIHIFLLFLLASPALKECVSCRPRHELILTPMNIMDRTVDPLYS